MRAGFDPFTQTPPDLMHDELEGNFRKHVSRIIKGLLLPSGKSPPFLTVDALNDLFVTLREEHIGTGLDLRLVDSNDLDRLREGQHLMRTGTFLPVSF
jgi:hypothetical protein